MTSYNIALTTVNPKGSVISSPTSQSNVSIIREIENVRRVAPGLPLLIPGIGAQGGDAIATVRAARTPRKGAHAVINSSRAILYASSDKDFDIAARDKAIETKNLLNSALNVT